MFRCLFVCVHASKTYAIGWASESGRKHEHLCDETCPPISNGREGRCGRIKGYNIGRYRHLSSLTRGREELSTHPCHSPGWIASCPVTAVPPAHRHWPRRHRRRRTCGILLVARAAGRTTAWRLEHQNALRRVEYSTGVRVSRRGSARRRRNALGASPHQTHAMARLPEVVTFYIFREPGKCSCLTQSMLISPSK